jgi:nucleoid DNA-binding protein
MAKKAAAKGAEGGATRAKAATKAEIYTTVADKTGLSKKQVSGVFEAYADLIRRELGKKGPGVIVLPGVAKLKAKRKPATKATTKPNPFKPGEMMTVKAKPASTNVRIVALKAFKDQL